MLPRDEIIDYREQTRSFYMKIKLIETFSKNQNEHESNNKI